MRGISEREKHLPNFTLPELLRIMYESKSIISLSAGEPDFTTPRPLLRYGASIIHKSTHYTPTQGLKELREAICKKLKKENKINAIPENVIVTTGSQEAIFASLLTTTDPKDQVLIPNPGYLAYLPAIELSDGKPISYKLSEENNFQPDPDQIKKLVNKKTKAIIVNSPSNPTGQIYSRKLLEEIAGIAREKNLYILSDEAYERLIYDGEKHVSIASLNGMKEYVISLYTFSKSYAMCGFRVGYVVSPKNLSESIIESSHFLTISPTHISQLMAIKALSLPNRYINRMVRAYNRRRKYLVKRLNEINLITKEPKGAFYAFSNIKYVTKKSSYKFSQDLLKKAKVAVVPGTEFGEYGEGYIRFSYATKLFLIKKALERIEKYLK
ncbi:pyridoxal phosphate-dependent aminotransferase [Candidatus Woesearchaeota archaeon]|nr:pyridoxal phosphate-dependent aminotransferase [Candidatus Woesearchaeota archaeon]